MDTPDDGLDAVLSFMTAHPDEFDEETIRKIEERGIVIEDFSRPGWIVVDVERHRAVFGGQWKKGEPLASFITYWERYALSPSQEKLQSLGRQRPSEFHFDGGSANDLDDYSFTVESNPAGGFRISEDVTNESAIVHAEQEVLAFADRLVDAFSLDGIMERVSGALGPNQRDICLQEIKKNLTSDMRARAIEAWRARETEP